MDDDAAAAEEEENPDDDVSPDEVFDECLKNDKRLRLHLLRRFKQGCLLWIGPVGFSLRYLVGFVKARIANATLKSLSSSYGT